MLQLDNEFFGDYQLEPEQELFVAIVQRAILDIQVMQTLPPRAPHGHHARVRYNQVSADGRDAANFLFKPGDLDEWAGLVGVDATTIRRLAGREFPELRRVSCSL